MDFVAEAQSDQVKAERNERIAQMRLAHRTAR
jgi:hypothetical protein